MLFPARLDRLLCLHTAQPVAEGDGRMTLATANSKAFTKLQAAVF